MSAISAPPAFSLAKKGTGLTRRQAYRLPAGFSRPESEREQERLLLDVLVKAACEASRGRYGSLKISRALAAQGKPYRRNRVAFSMRRQGLRSKIRRKFVVTTDTKHDLKASPNLLNRSFDAGRPNEVWVSDITYFSSR